MIMFLVNFRLFRAYHKTIIAHASIVESVFNLIAVMNDISSQHGSAYLHVLSPSTAITAACFDSGHFR